MAPAELLADNFKHTFHFLDISKKNVSNPIRHTTIEQ